jgi:hypothetical protein
VFVRMRVYVSVCVNHHEVSSTPTPRTPNARFRRNSDMWDLAAFVHLMQCVERKHKEK